MRRMVAPILAAMAVLGGCGIDAGDGGASPGGARLGPERSAGSIVEELRASVALVQTPLGSGSAVVLDDGYLVTNAHVVDPYGEVDVTFEGGQPERLGVVAVDLEADLALVGPSSANAPAAQLVDPVDLANGSDVYLVGFPGDQREIEATLSSGVLSRRRTAEGWGLEFLQTDTVIAGGQSGGALVDAWGRVIAISGMRDGDGFALSLAGGDVIERVDRLRRGEGSDWSPIPHEIEDRSWTFPAPDPVNPRTFYLPAAVDARELTLEIDGPEPAVAVADPGYAFAPWTANDVAFDVEAISSWYLDDAEVLESESDGVWTVSIDAGFDAVIVLAGGSVGEELSVRSSEPMVERPGIFSEGRTVEVGDEVDFALGYLDDGATFEIDLDEGQVIEVLASSAVGDVAWEIAPNPSTGLDDDEIDAARGDADDGGGGLLDLDALGTYTATVDGWHVLYVYGYDGAPTDVRLRIDAG